MSRIQSFGPWLLRSLGAHVVFVLAVAVAVSAGIVFAIQSLVHDSALRHHAMRRVEVTATSVAELGTLLAGHVPTVPFEQILGAGAESSDVLAMRVLDDAGTVRHSNRRHEIGTMVDDSQSTYSPRDRRGIELLDEGTVADYRTLVDAARAPTCRGCHSDGSMQSHFQIVLDTGKASRALTAERRNMTLGIGLAHALLLSLLGLLFRHRVTVPLHRMLTSIRQVGEGDLDTRVEIATPAEFAELGAQFNNMVENIQDARTELDAYYNENITRADRLATLGEVTATLAHEIQNPLTGISAVLGVLSEDPALAHRGEMIEETMAAVDRLGRTVDNILAYGRISVPTLEDTDLQDLVDSVLFFVRQHQPRGATLRVMAHVEHDAQYVRTDPRQLQQVLLNICLNAVQAMPEGGTLTAHASKIEFMGHDFVRLSIIDTGSGIPPEIMDQIFEPFFTTKTCGTGLGLAISRRIVADSGGHLNVVSTVGKGTRVDIDIPLASPEAVSATDDVDEDWKLAGGS